MHETFIISSNLLTGF